MTDNTDAVAWDVSRALSAQTVIDTLNAENKALSDQLRVLQRSYVIVNADLEALGVGVDALNTENRKLRDELTVATVAAQAASTFYWAEWAGEKTYLTPAQVRERFADAMVAYREATGVEK